MSTRHDDQQALLQALQAVGSHEALRQADLLRALYHARETAGLSHDVYAAARVAPRLPASRPSIESCATMLSRARRSAAVMDGSVAECDTERGACAPPIEGSAASVNSVIVVRIRGTRVMVGGTRSRSRNVDARRRAVLHDRACASQRTDTTTRA